MVGVVVTVAGVEVNFVELVRCDGQCGGRSVWW